MKMGYSGVSITYKWYRLATVQVKALADTGTDKNIITGATGNSTYLLTQSDTE